MDGEPEERSARFKATTEPSPLELSPAAMRRLVEVAAERLIGYLASLGEQPACDLEGGAELARSLVEPLPETGMAAEALLAELFESWIPKSLNTAGPGFLGYIPGGGLFHAAVADFIADGVNRYVGIPQPAPALAQLEANVIRWFCDIVGYPPAARGFLSSGGSLANFTAVATARAERLPEDFLSGTLYASDQVHHSLLKAARLAGFPAANVRTVGSDSRQRIRLGELRRRLAADRRDGFTPFLLLASAGTTNTGAVDDLAALASLARDEGLWLHADAAYGGFFALTRRGRRALAGLEQADSITLDPHKGLFLPYGTGGLLVRDGDALARLHGASAEYMPAKSRDDELVDFAQISPELSRDFRGLRVWLPLKMHGAQAFRDALDEKLDLARWAARRLQRLPAVELVGEPQLSIVAFRLRPEDLSQRQVHRLNRQLLAAVNGRQRVYLTGTTVRGRFVLRLAILSFRTHRPQLEAALEDIAASAAELLAAPPASLG